MAHRTSTTFSSELFSDSSLNSLVRELNDKALFHEDIIGKMSASIQQLQAVIAYHQQKALEIREQINCICYPPHIEKETVTKTAEPQQKRAKKTN